MYHRIFAKFEPHPSPANQLHHHDRGIWQIIGASKIERVLCNSVIMLKNTIEADICAIALLRVETMDIQLFAFAIGFCKNVGLTLRDSHFHCSVFPLNRAALQLQQFLIYIFANCVVACKPTSRQSSNLHLLGRIIQFDFAKLKKKRHCCFGFFFLLVLLCTFGKNHCYCPS
ncbi:Lysophospholipase NTE1 [Trichinella spiralis]|uniref:Lysophospholipase NTE1 n=1 Tax=Trichinella spiralis TaxID=6334 RepID=A0ABR3KMK0_TRISP